MSTRGVDFIHRRAWRPVIAEFVAALFQCLAAAVAQGITMAEIEEELRSDTIIFDALMNDAASLRRLFGGVVTESGHTA